MVIVFAVRRRRADGVVDGLVERLSNPIGEDDYERVSRSACTSLSDLFLAMLFVGVPSISSLLKDLLYGVARV